MLFAIVLAAVVASLWRRKRAMGTYIAVTCLLYAPVRFALDFLRADDRAGGDARYFALTPGQWAAILLLGIGVVAARLAFEERGLPRRTSTRRRLTAGDPV